MGRDGQEMRTGTKIAKTFNVLILDAEIYKGVDLLGQEEDKGCLVLPPFFPEEGSSLSLAVIHLQNISEPSPHIGVRKSNLKIISAANGSGRWWVSGLIRNSVGTTKCEGVQGFSWVTWIPQMCLLKCCSVLNIRNCLQWDKVRHSVLCGPSLFSFLEL